MIMWIGAAIAGTTALTSLIGNSIKKRREQKFANKENQRLAEQQRDWNKEQWEAQNAYNDPAQQMARLQGAGLNPRFIYGSSAQSAAGNAADVKGYDRAEAQTLDTGLQGFGEISDQFRQAVQTDNVQQQTDLAQQDKLLKAQQTLKTISEIDSNRFDLGLKNSLKQTSIDVAKYGAETAKQNMEQSRIGTNILSQTAQVKIEQAQQELALAKAKNQGQATQNDILEFDRKLKAEGLQPTDNLYLRIAAQNGINSEMIKRLADKYLAPVNSYFK